MSERDLLVDIQSKMHSLSKGQKRIANFLIEHYDKAVSLTAIKLGEIAGVSESTVVRFAIEIGYEGYPQFQKALKELVKNKLTAKQRIEVATDIIFKENKNILKTVLRSDADRINMTLNEIDEDAFDVAVDSIIAAKKVYIVGSRSAGALANFFYFYLRLVLDNVILVESGTINEVFEQIFRISEEDVCIAISFPRYSQRTVKAIEYANAQNAKTIAITDNVNSPIAAYANYLLKARCDMISFVDSLSAPLSIINALLVAISIKKKADLNDRFEKLEHIWNEYQVYSTSNTYKYKANPFEGEEA